MLVGVYESVESRDYRGYESRKKQLFINGVGMHYSTTPELKKFMKIFYIVLSTTVLYRRI